MNLLDTDILIDVQRGHAPAVAWFQSLTQLPSVPGFVIMELIQDARDTKQLQQTVTFVALLPFVWPNADDCNRALANFRALRFSHNLGLLDALIAACTVGLAATLCTFNVKHYRVIPDLVTLPPYRR